ncbi:MAG: hypothetical protein R6X14_01300 [bacterium]
MADAPLGATAPAVPRGRFARVLAGLLRFFGLWVGITGLYSLPGAICPCCGHSGCQVGWGGAAILGALGSLIVLKGRLVVSALRARLRKS